MPSRASLPIPRRDHTTSSFTELLALERPSERDHEPSDNDILKAQSDLPQSTKGYTSLHSGNAPVWQAQGVRDSWLCGSVAIVSDLLLAITPLLFVFLAVAGMILDQGRTADNGFGVHVEAATKVAPTLFPIVFAAVAARSLRIYARFRAERGARLGLLETLMGSRSVFAAIETQYLIRKPSFVGILILLLWALSPLGGQASLRLLTRGLKDVGSTAQFRYLDTGPAAGIWPTSGFGPSASAYEDIEQALLSAAIMSTDAAKLSSMDTWKNVKIPRIDAFSSGPSPDDWTNWTAVPANITSVQDYTSLIGIPIIGLQSATSSALNIETSYVDFDCSTPVESVANDAFWNRTWGVMWGPSQTNPIDNTPAVNEIHRTMFMDTYFTLNDDARQLAYFGLELTGRNESDPLLNSTRHIVFGSVSGDDNELLNVVTTNCSISSVHVESAVVCNSTDCTVAQMRRSTIDKRPSTVSFFDVDAMGGKFMKFLPTTGGNQLQMISSPAEIFLNDTSLTPFNTAIFDNFVNLTTVSANDLSKRLTMIANTYFQLLTAPGAFLGDRQTDLTAYGPDSTPIAMIDNWFGHNATLDDIISSLIDTPNVDFMPLLGGRAEQLTTAPFVAAYTQGTKTTTHEVFVCNFFWAAVLLLSSLVLLGLGSSAVIVNVLLVAPDILGYVASMTYDNPHLPIDPVGLPMNAMERARHLRDLRVRIGDVRVEDNVGYVAFTDVRSSARVRRERTYRSAL